jgi:hypothetical protein
MLSSYVVGNLLGRLLVSYLLVFLLCLGLAKGDWRGALARTRRWYGVLAVVVVFALGLAGSVGSRMADAPRGPVPTAGPSVDADGRVTIQAWAQPHAAGRPRS